MANRRGNNRIESSNLSNLGHRGKICHFGKMIIAAGKENSGYA